MEKSLKLHFSTLISSGEIFLEGGAHQEEEKKEKSFIAKKKNK